MVHTLELSNDRPLATSGSQSLPDLPLDHQSQFHYITGTPCQLSAAFPGPIGCITITSCVRWPPLPITPLLVGEILDPQLPLLVTHQRDNRVYALGYLFTPPTSKYILFRHLSRSPDTDTRPRSDLHFYIPTPGEDDPYAHTTIHDDKIGDAVGNFEAVLMLGSMAENQTINMDLARQTCMQRQMLFQNPVWRVGFVMAFHIHVTGLVHTKLEAWMCTAYRGLARIQLGSEATPAILDRVTESVEKCFEAAREMYETWEHAQEFMRENYGTTISRAIELLRNRIENYEEFINCKACTEFEIE